MHKTPSGNRLHIGIFGRRNAGKSSLINAIAGQDLAIVSEVAGTTTDPVLKAMEINPLGPVMLIDTAGLDDESALGKKRIAKTMAALSKTDLALIVLDPKSGIGGIEKELAKTFTDKKLPFIYVMNKSDTGDGPGTNDEEIVSVSSKTKEGIEDLKQKIINMAPKHLSPYPLVRDFVKRGDVVVLVIPIDSAMPQGRLILPEVQVLRDALDAGAMVYVSKDSELKELLQTLKKAPDLVITDSQAFSTVKEIIPSKVPLTSFSIIFARHRGDLKAFVDGAKTVDELKDGDAVLIAEACTHHVQPTDIGRKKIPAWIKEFTGKNIKFDTVAGADYPKDLKKYKLMVHCGACMINRAQVLDRIGKAKEAGLAVTNYGVLIAYLNGVLERAVKPLML